MTVTAPTSTASTPIAASTMPAALLERARRQPGVIALRKRHYGLWKQYSWSDYAGRAARVGVGLAAIGVRPGERVAVLSSNRPAWLFADLGIQGIGATTVALSPSASAEEVERLLAHSQSVVVIAEDQEQYDKLVGVLDRLSALRRLVVIDPRGVPTGADAVAMTFGDLESLGDHGAVEAWHQGASQLDPMSLATLVYSADATGTRRAAMLSHANLHAAALSLVPALGVAPDDEYLSYLPLDHIAERLGTGPLALHAGYVVNFGAGPEALTADLFEVQPTVFLGVAAVWERLAADVEQRIADASRLKRTAYRAALGQGYRLVAARQRGHLGLPRRVRAALASLLALRSVRSKLGFSRLRVALSTWGPGGAMDSRVLEYFWSIGVPLLEGYMPTESTGMAAWMPRTHVDPGTVGVALDQVSIRVTDSGEVLLRGPGVFLGYDADDGATAAALGGDGWLRTGDLGSLDADGYLTIVDRDNDR